MIRLSYFYNLKFAYGSMSLKSHFVFCEPKVSQKKERGHPASPRKKYILYKFKLKYIIII